MIFAAKSIVFKLPFPIFTLSGLKSDYIEQVWIASQYVDC